MGIALLFDVVEMMRRASGKADATMGVVIQMSLFSCRILQACLPFTVCLARCLRSGGLQMRRDHCYGPVFDLAVWFHHFSDAGVGNFSGNHLQSIFRCDVDQVRSIETKYLKRTTSMLNISRTGLWLQQSDTGGQAVIRALRVSKER